MFFSFYMFNLLYFKLLFTCTKSLHRTVIHSVVFVSVFTLFIASSTSTSSTPPTPLHFSLFTLLPRVFPVCLPSSVSYFFSLSSSTIFPSSPPPRRPPPAPPPFIKSLSVRDLSNISQDLGLSVGEWQRPHPPLA